MKNKITTVFIITSIVFAGTALATVLTTNPTTKNLLLGSKAAVSTTTAPKTANASALNTVLEATEHAIAYDLASAISRALGLEVGGDEISALKARNMGYGEITLAYNLAQASGKSVNEILEMRYEQKMGWGNIAKTLGVKLHDKADKSAVILREVRLDNDADNFLASLRIDLDAEDNDNAHGNHHKHAVDNDNSNDNPAQHKNEGNGNGNGHGNGNGNGHGKH